MANGLVCALRLLAPGAVLGLVLLGCSGREFESGPVNGGASGAAGATGSPGGGSGASPVRAGGAPGAAGDPQTAGSSGASASGGAPGGAAGEGGAGAPGGASSQPHSGGSSGFAAGAGNAGAPATEASGGGGVAGASEGASGAADTGGGEAGGSTGCTPGSAGCPIALGDECTTNSECGSDFCVDGVCCESACNEVCARCDAAGDEGTCVSAIEDGACEALSCPADAECRSYVRTDPGNCVDIGECRASAECVAQNLSMVVTCAEGTGTCDGQGACAVPNLASLGHPCSVDEECAEGACVVSTSGDSVCCDAACDGPCQACGDDGHCDEVPADDDQCGVIACDAGDDCTSYPEELTSNRCASFSQCVTTVSYCEATYSAEGEACGSSMECNGAGECLLVCPSEQVACEGACIDPETDPDYCGAFGDCSGAAGGATCGGTDECLGGECVLACSANELRCDGTCIDPVTNLDYCGASGGCTGASAGAACRDNEICANGECEIECYGGNVVCGDTCINPRSNETYCGAAGACDSSTDGTSCSSGASCVMGACASWGTPTAISSNAANVQVSEPQVGVDESGNILVVWYQYENSASTVRSRYFNGTSWGSEVTLNGEPSDDAGSQQLAMNRSGVAWAAWTEYDETRENVWVRRFASGAWSGSPVQLTSDEWMYDPRVAVASNGDAIVVWRRSLSYELWGRIYSGGAWGSATRLSGTLGTRTDTENPQVIMPVSGAPLVIWEQYDDTTSEVGLYSSFLTGGSWQATPVPVASNTGFTTTAVMAADSSGNSRVAYKLYRGEGQQIHTRSFDATSQTWNGDDAPIGGSATTYPSDPSIATDSAGNSVVVWRDSGSGANTVASSLVVANGLWTPELRIEDAAGRVFPATTAASSDGMVIAAWPQQNSDSQDNVTVNTFNAAGGTWDGARVIQSDTSVGGYEPSAAFSQSGKAVVAWRQNGATSSDASRIWVAQLD